MADPFEAIKRARAAAEAADTEAPSRGAGRNPTRGRTPNNPVAATAREDEADGVWRSAEQLQQELTYEDVVARVGEDHYVAQNFERIAGDSEFRTAVDGIADGRRQRAMDLLSNAEQYRTSSQATIPQREFQERVTSFESDLQSLGQGETIEDFRNIAEMSTLLLALEGDENAENRTLAADILSTYGDQIQPHLEEVAPGWWEQNAELIEESRSGDPNVVMQVLGRAANSSVGSYLLDTLAQTEQGAMQALRGITSAVQDDGVSAGEGLSYAGSGLLRGLAGLGDRINPLSQGARAFGLDIPDPGLDPNNPRLLTGEDGGLLSPDLDGDGMLNLREAIGRDPEAGGRLAGAFDTLGMAALDPLSWITLGQSGRVRAGVQVLRSSSDEAAQVIGTRLRNGARFADLSDIDQAVARSAWQDAAANAMSRTGRLTRAQRSAVQRIRRQAADESRYAQQATRRQVDRWEQAVTRGSVPGVRLFGVTVVPTTRVYSALGIIDSRLASEAAWAQKLTRMSRFTDSSELFQFIQTWDGRAIPDEVRSQLEGMERVGELLSDDTAFDTMSQLLELTNRTDEAFDQIEAFGREFLGDQAVDGWRQWYRTAYTPGRRETVTELPAEDGLPSVRFSVRRQVEELVPEDLPLESAERVQRNLDILNNPAEFMMTTLTVPGRRGRVSRSAFVQRMADRFSPRAAIRRSGRLGERVADEVDDITARNAALRTVGDEFATRLQVRANGQSELFDAAAKELGDDSIARITRAFSDDRAMEVADELAAEGLESSARLTRLLDEIQRDSFELSIRSGADADVFLQNRGYLPRTRTRDASRLASRMLGDENTAALDRLRDMGVVAEGDAVNQRATVASTLGQQGRLAARTYRPDLKDLNDVNRAARQDLIDAGVPEALVRDLDIYESNPVTAIMMRNRQAREAHLMASTLFDLSEVTDGLGRQVAYVARTPEELARTKLNMRGDISAAGGSTSEFTEIPLPNGGRVFVNSTVANELTNTRRLIRSPEFQSGFRRMMTEWNNLWGAYATAGSIGAGSLGFFARNTIGNVYNMTLAGANPASIGQAMQLQGVQRSVRRAMREGGDSFADAARRTDVSPQDLAMLQEARKYDILSGLTEDIFSDGSQFGGRFNPLSQDNMLVRTGRTLSSAVEGNARLALFIDGVNKGMTPADAARRVRTYLFDYGDLTSFEADSVRMLSRFYTFMRKNTALQANVLMANPGRAANANRAVDTFMDLILGDRASDPEGDGYLGEGRVLPEWAQNSLSIYRGGDLAAGYDTPLASFTETADIARDLMRTAPNLVRLARAESDEEREAAMQSLQDDVLSSLTLLSGGPVEGVRTLAEFATNTDLFIGAKLTDVDTEWYDTLFRLTDIIAPIGSRTVGTIERVGDAAEGDRDQARAYLLSAIGGMTVLNLADDERRERNMIYLSWQLEEALETAQEGVPEDQQLTFDELMRAGDRAYEGRALQQALYYAVTGEKTTEEAVQYMNDALSGDYAELLGLVQTEGAERAEKTAAERAQTINGVIAIANAQGIEVTQEMLDAMILRESGARRTDARLGGFEDQFRTNPYLSEDGEELSKAERAALATEQIGALAGQFGRSPEQIREQYPVLSDAERKYNDMLEAGLSQADIQAEMLDWLSRREQASLLELGAPVGELETTRELTPNTPEEQIEDMARAAQREAEMRVVMQVFTGRQPSEDEVLWYLQQTLLTTAQQREAGVERLRVPSRKNVTSDEVYSVINQDAMDAIDQRQTFSSSFLAGLGGSE